MKQSKTKRQVNSLVRAVERRQEHPRQVRTHYAVVSQIGVYGAEDERGKHYSTCLTKGCRTHSPFYIDEEDAKAWCHQHNDLPPMELPDGTTPETDWYGGRALRPWELGLDIDARLRILFGPGAV